MNNYMTWQDKQEQVLAVLANICYENNIRMFLCGETALCAYRDGVLSDFVSVCVDAGDAYNLINAVNKYIESNAEYALEGMFNNGCYPNLELRFCDKTTTDFDANNFSLYVNNCIHVNIKFIEHLSSLKVPFALSRVAFKKYRQNANPMVDKGNVGKSAALFKRMIKTASCKSTKVWLNGHEESCSMFEVASTVEINGRTYLIPGNGKDYLDHEFGHSWNTYECHKYEETVARFITCTFSWEEYSKAIKDINFEEFEKARQKEKSEAVHFRKIHAKVVACYDILERTFDRIYLYEKYNSRKSYILKLNQENKLDELRKELAEYIEFINKYYSRKLGMCFDPDILDIAMKIISVDYGNKYAEAVRSLVPEEHLKPIRLKDYKGNYI